MIDDDIRRNRSVPDTPLKWERFCDKWAFNKLDKIFLGACEEVYLAERLINDPPLPPYYEMVWATGLGERMDVGRTIQIPAYREDGVLITQDKRTELARMDAEHFFSTRRKVGVAH